MTAGDGGGLDRTLIERELLEPRLFDFGDTRMFMDRYKTGDDGEAHTLLPASYPSAQNTIQ